MRGIPTLDGITAERITTNRITTRVLFAGGSEGIPVIFLHGNWSCATWWEETMLALPEGYWAIAFDQRGYGQADHERKVDATQGAGDFSDDAAALLDHLNIERAHILGCSMGGAAVWRMMRDYPTRFRSGILVNPASPYGFSGTKDEIGTPCFGDFAGTGGGLRNQELIKRVVENDRSAESEFSPRVSLRTLFHPGFENQREEELLSSVLATHIGDQDIPGDFTESPNWPYLAPGVWGANNAASPKYAGDVSEIYDGRCTAPILWVRGECDQVISDTSGSDTGFLGKTGVLPGWPGDSVYPPQPMLRQTRYVLDKYAAAGGQYVEEVIPKAGHVPFIDQPDEFNQVLHEFIRKVDA
jgi:pimeloyl-ACP methyl ester carboxylesterase